MQGDIFAKSRRAVGRRFAETLRASAFGLLFPLVLFSPRLVAQTTEPETPPYTLDEVVVVGDRSESLLRESTTPTDILTRQELEMIPARNLVDALHYLSGITFVAQDASGHLPMAVVRGFFGGGEAEYLLLQVDGVPVNDLRTGLINWNQIPYSEIERIEITRGGGSAMYGDLALGAVINITTRSAQPRNLLSVSGKGGQFGTRGGDLFYRTSREGRQFHLRGAAERVSGYRDHSDYRNFNAGGGFDYALKSSGKLAVRVNFDRLDKDDPGPLTEGMVRENRRQSHPMFVNDNRRRNQYDASLRYQSSGDRENHFSVGGGIRGFRQEQTRTLQLTSEFGDTQFEAQNNYLGWAQVQYRRQTGAARWIGGVDADAGRYESKYFSADRASRLSRGEGSRQKFGAYLESKTTWSGRLRATVGVRYDWIKNRSKFAADAAFSQFSPRAGINLQYSHTPSRAGHLYFGWSRAFKAPTLDQLYDTRIIRFFGQEFHFANTALQPQRSGNFDAGVYQQFPLPGSGWFGELSLSAYLLNISNEIDLDLVTFTYANIQKSRHTGLEGTLGLYFTRRLEFHHTANWMKVRFESGDFKGNQLKHIPQSTFSNRLSLRLSATAALTFTHRFFDKVYLDDANQFTLPGFHVLDGQLQWRFRQIQFDLMVQNLADNAYNSSGYVLFDVLLRQNVTFLYPAQGRFFRLAAQYHR